MANLTTKAREIASKRFIFAHKNCDDGCRDKKFEQALFESDVQAVLAFGADAIEQAVGEDEDLNAPLNRAIDGNPESDAEPDLYLVRRATRDLLRADARTFAARLREGKV